MFTTSEKLQCAEREVGYRKRVFARLVEQGKMKQELADKQIAIMSEIADDYRRQVVEEEPNLFSARVRGGA